MTGSSKSKDDRDEKEKERIQLLLTSLERDTRLAKGLETYIGDGRTVVQRLTLLRRLAGDVEAMLVHPDSIKALKEMNRYLQMKEENLHPSPAAPRLDLSVAAADTAMAVLEHADKGLDGTVAQYREMAVWSTMEPNAATAFNAAWSNAVSAAALVRTVALCAHFSECNHGLPGWMTMQAYAMWRNCITSTFEKPNDALTEVIRRTEELLKELNAAEEVAGHGT